MKQSPREKSGKSSVAIEPLPFSKTLLRFSDNPPESMQMSGAKFHEDAEEVLIQTINVLLVDDHKLIREGLRQLLELEEDITIVDEAVNGLEAIQKIRRFQPDVVLMDVQMPIVNGITVTQQMTREFPHLAVIMLTMYQQDQFLFQAMKSGARGYLFKNASSQEVAQAIRNTFAGRMHMDPLMAGVLVNEFRRLSDANVGGPPISGLTEKEIEILRYIAAGMSNREIAVRLSYSEKTVKNYLSTIFHKLGIRDRTQAAIFAYRSGLIPEDS